MSEADELRGLPQDLAPDSRMALLEAARCANAMLDDDSPAHRAKPMARLSHRQADELLRVLLP